ncbi:hypothetical protein DC522_14545 [Microvirga sp. KLBC 81]|nr:hypothetical protein DC522_14545 [Microvirga sp. KLBC 81]
MLQQGLLDWPGMAACPISADVREGNRLPKGRNFRLLAFRMRQLGPRLLEHRAEPKVRVSEKWIRFSALNDALIEGESIG